MQCADFESNLGKRVLRKMLDQNQEKKMDHCKVRVS